MTAAPRHARDPAARHRRGFSLIELAIATLILSVIVAAMGSVIVLAARGLETGMTTGVAAGRQADVTETLLRDLQFATAITERTGNAVTFTVPDRDGDGDPETIRYAWEDGLGNPGVAGDPVKRVSNGGAPVTVIPAVDEFSLTYLTRVVRGDWIPVEDDTFTLLLVLKDPTNLTSSEQAQKDLIESWGYTVTLIDDEADQIAYDVATAQNRVAYVTEEVDAGKLSTKLTTAPIGVVNEHQKTTEYLEIESKETKDYGATDVTIVDTTHPITSAFPPGDLTIATGSIKMLRPDGPLALGANVLASKHDDASKGVLVVVETGDTLDDGSPAAGRRVALPWGKDLDFADIDATGRLLMKRAVNWAAGNETLGGTLIGYNTAFESPVTSVRRLQIATQATLAESGTVSQIGAFIGGANSGCRFAIYSDAAGEPDALLVESVSFTTESSYDWQSVSVTPTPLAPGTYWLALSFASSNHYFFHESGGELRYRDHRAEQHGFLAGWGASDDTFSVKMSIYAAYTPD